jgi:hypothetical protein
MTWKDECAWMDEFPPDDATSSQLSWQELELLKQDTPYFALRVLMRRYSMVQITKLHCQIAQAFLI